MQKNDLIGEAQFFHTAIFNRPPTAIFIEHYIDAHKHSDQFRASDIELEAVKKIIDLKIHPKFLDVLVRRKFPAHLFTRKLWLIFYLAECSGNDTNVFLPNDSGIMFWLRLFFLLPKTLLHYAWGSFLVKCYAVF